MFAKNMQSTKIKLRKEGRETKKGEKNIKEKKIKEKRGEVIFCVDWKKPSQGARNTESGKEKKTSYI